MAKDTGIIWLISPCTYRKTAHTAQKYFGGSDQVGEQATEEIATARGEEVDVSVRTVEVGKGRCGRIWPEHISVFREQIRKP